MTSTGKSVAVKYAEREAEKIAKLAAKRDGREDEYAAQLAGKKMEAKIASESIKQLQKINKKKADNDRLSKLHNKIDISPENFSMENKTIPSVHIAQDKTIDDLTNQMNAIEIDAANYEVRINRSKLYIILLLSSIFSFKLFREKSTTH
jgi:hypothetical protein